MHEIDLEELKKIELELLIQFREICKIKGFRYTLAAGTLLGAVRHKGFIPWDDDIDVCMPRPDYDSFINYCKNNKTPFNLVSKENVPGYGYLFAKLYAPYTVIKEEISNPNNVQMGVYIDIFPIDAMGKNWLLAQVDFLKGAILKRFLVAKNWKKYFKSKTHSWYVEPIRFVFYLLSRFLSMKKMIKLLDKIYCRDDEYYKNSNLVGSISCEYNYRKIYPKSVFEDYIELPFEDEKFSCIKDYHIFLKSLYGDYMKLPPKEKQVSHHIFTAYYKE